MGDLLIVRLKERNGRFLKYKNSVNSEDYKQVALVLFDLSNNIPLDKAIKEYQQMKEGGSFPW